MEQHFFMHGNVPHIALVLQLGESKEVSSASAGQEMRRRQTTTDEVENALPEGKRAVFRALREWRNRLAKTMDVLPYKIASNQQFVNIVNAAPSTMAELAQVKDIGHTFCEKFGEPALRIMALARQESEKAETEKSAEEGFYNNKVSEDNTTSK